MGTAEAEGAEAGGSAGVKAGDTITLRDSETPQVRPGGLEVDDALKTKNVAVAEVKGLKAGARPQKLVNVDRPDEVEVDDLEGGEAGGVGAGEGTEANSASVADEDTRQVGTTRREDERG